MMIMGVRFLHVIAYLFLLCMRRTTGSGLKGNANSKVQCIESEKEALLKFKQGFQNPSSGLFSSWAVEEEEDCCRWRGVGCNHSTPGHIISLNLSGSGQRGEQLSDSLLDLPYLSSLDLSQNNFLQAQIPNFIGSLSHLKHLNLSNSNFKGRIPDHLGNLSRLRSLDLSTKSYSVLRANNLNWLRGLSSLEFLDLGGVDLSSSTVDWLDSTNMLPSLVELHLSACRLQKFHHPSLPYNVNFTSLEILDLSHNNFSSSIPPWLFNISHSLASVNLRGSQLQSLIPNAFGNMTSLIVLDLSDNNLEGEIPTFLGLNVQAENQLKLPSSGLRELYLSQNQLSGSLEILSQLSQLVVLRVANNLLEGTISEAHLNFSSLRVLDLSSNYGLKFNISSNWIPPFQLHTIGLGSCQLGPQFPEWLRTQKYVFYLDISNVNISDTVPHWFWNISDKIHHIVLSYNHLRGKLPPDFSSKANLLALDLSENNFDGPLPRFSANLVDLDLYSNSFFGPIFSICEMLVLNNTVRFLDLSSNAFSGSIPDCWTYGEELVILNLGDNNLSYNKLSGEIPREITSLTRLFSLNLSSNRLTGTIPDGIGDIKYLKELDLSRNELSCTIPPTLSNLSSLSFLNLSYNRLSGKVPSLNRSKNFDGSCFMENHKLCGYPLANDCSFNENYEDPDCREERIENNYVGSQDEDGGVGDDVFLQIPVFYFSMGLGFIVGFWVFWGTLLVKDSWRHAYFQFLDNLYDQIFVLVVVYGTRLRRRFQNNYAAE